VIRVLAAIGIALLSLGCDAQSYATRLDLDVIDLDVPGNLEAVARGSPDHFAKIQRILDEVPQRPPAADAVAKWMRTEFHAEHIQYTDLVMTSYPPKRRLEFSLDNTFYVKVVTVMVWDTQAEPLKKIK
jgi:hypothetical protein